MSDAQHLTSRITEWQRRRDLGITPDNLQRIPLDALPREMLPLACAANLALERLSQPLAAEKRLVADAAHEPRTPLTVLDLRPQKARMDGHSDWSAIDSDMQQLHQLTEQLLRLARQARMKATAASAHRLR
ncbi:MAG: hypothetical protein AB7G13_10745 [Lautropia sp.]